MIKRKILILFVITTFLFGCNMPSQSNQAGLNPGQSGVSWNLVTADPNSTQTPTPFMPLQQTQTFEAPQATATPLTATTTPVAGETPVGDVPVTPAPGAAMLKLPDGLVNILIFGSDMRADSGYRTDTMVLASINTKDGTVSMISFPRDLFVNIPGWEMQRLNTSQAHGGFKMTQDTFEYNFGIKPDYYIMTTFSGFTAIINSLGGIDVNAAQNLSDKCDVSVSRSKWCSVGPGVVHMNSGLALWYIRSRYSTNDTDRGRRAIEVLEAIFSKVMTVDGISKAPELYAQFKNTFDTDITLADVLPLLPLASGLTDTSKIRHFTIGYNLSSDWVTPDGAMVLIPNLPGIRDAIQKTITGQ
jgi:LCP family protein required for cell wall assembly